MTYCTRVDEETDVRIQLCSVKPGNKEICKSVKQRYSSQYIFFFLKIAFYITMCYFLLTGNGFIIVTPKKLSNYLLTFSPI